MKCPRCQQENRAAAKFCEECATPLKAVSPGGPPARSYEQVTNALHEAPEQQTATAEILRVISSSPTDVQPVFNTIVRSAMRLCDAQSNTVFRFDGELLHLVAHHDSTPELLEILHRLYPMRPSREQASGRAVLSGAVVQIPDVLADPDYQPEVAHATGWRSRLAVPIIREGTPIGAIVINRTVPGLFPDHHVELLKTFADQAVIAIENVRLFTELQEKNRALTQAHGQVTEALERQTATSEILRVISQSPTDVEPVFETIVQSALRLLDGYSAVLRSLRGNEMHLVAFTSTTAEGDTALGLASVVPV